MSQQRPTICHLSPESYDAITAATQRSCRTDCACARLRKMRMSSPRDSDRFLIVCDGTIGCGKTFFLNRLCRSQHMPHIRICREPVPKSEKKSWWSLLEKFYHSMSTTGPRQSPHKAVIHLENAILQHHHDIATSRSTHIITERSFSSSVRVFCKALHDKGILPKSSWAQFSW